MSKMDRKQFLYQFSDGLKTEGSYPGGGLVVVKLFSLRKKFHHDFVGEEVFVNFPGFCEILNSWKIAHHYQQLFSEF